MNTNQTLDSVSGSASQTTAGSNTYTPSNAVIKDADGNDVTSNYNITYTAGKITISKRPITIKAASASKTYDGKALTKNSASLTSGTIATGQTATYSASGTITNVGTADNVPSVVIKDASGNNVTSNYTVTKTNGTLTVTAQAVTISGNTASYVYDGASHTVSGGTATGLVSGHTLTSVSGSASQTAVGSKSYTPSAAVIKDGNGNDVTSNYVITYVNGSITITRKTDNITANNATRKVVPKKPTQVGTLTYNGTEQVPVWNIFSTDYYDVSPTGPNSSDASEPNVISAINAGTYRVRYVAKGGYNTTYNTATDENLVQTIAYSGDGTLSVKSSNTNVCTVSLNGKVLTIIPGNVSGTATITISATAGTTSAATSTTITFKQTFHTTIATWTIAKKSITVTGKTGNYTYDGKEHTLKSGSTTNLADGDVLSSVVGSASRTIVGKTTYTPSSAVIKNASGTVVTNNYVISYVDGYVNIKARAITITGASASKTYDGTALTNNSASLTSGTLADGHTATYSASGTITNAGTTNNVPNVVIKDANGNDVTSNYTVTKKNGTLTVNKRPITVTADSASKTYDGTALTKKTYKLTSGSLVSGDTLVISFSSTSTITNAGSVANGFASVAVKNSGGTYVTSNYDITQVVGVLAIDKKPVTITGKTGSFVYDGASHTVSGGTASGLISGHTLASVSGSASLTAVGTKSYTPSTAVIKDGGGNDVTSNYTVTYANGKITITSAASTISGASNASRKITPIAPTQSGTLTYNGATQTVTWNSTYNSSYMTIGGTQSGVNAGTYTGTFTAKGLFNSTYHTKVDSGLTQTITYNGDGTLTATSSNTNVCTVSISGNTLTITPQTTAGTATITISASAGTNYAATSTTITFTLSYASVSPTWTIGKKNVTIKGNVGSYSYDGSTHTVSGGTASGLVSGQTATIGNSASREEVGKTTYTPTIVKIVDASGNDVTENYNPKYVDGYVQITAQDITITGGSTSRMYDGTMLRYNVATITSGSLAPGHTATLSATGSIDHVGSALNTPNIVVRDASGNDVTSYYNVIKKNGLLTITPRPLVISGVVQEYIYDGMVHTAFTATADNLVEGQSIFTFGTVSGTDVGTYTYMPEEARITDAIGDIVTGNYIITYNPGTIIINPRPITIQAGDKSKEYDGTALVLNSVTLKAGSIAPNQTATYKASGSITNVGTTSNVPSVVIRDASGNDVTSNYVVTKTNGTLEVTKRNIVFDGKTATYVYDGTAHTVVGSRTTSGSLASGHKLASITGKATRTDVGSDDYTLSNAKIVDASNNDVTANYNITYGSGKIAINPYIIFDANGGVGTMANQTVPYNTLTALNKNNGSITRSGFSFIGWATSPIGDVIYKDGANITVTTNTVTLYAKWSKEIVIRTYVDGEQGNPYGDNDTVKVNDEVVELTDGEARVEIPVGECVVKAIDKEDGTYQVIERFDRNTMTGSTEVDIYYYTLTLTKDAGIDTVTGAGTYLSGTAVTIRAIPKTTNTFLQWSGTGSALTKAKTRSSNSVVITSKTAYKALSNSTYIVEYYIENEDGTYDLYITTSKTAQTGVEVNVTSAYDRAIRHTKVFKAAKTEYSSDAGTGTKSGCGTISIKPNYTGSSYVRYYYDRDDAPVTITYVLDGGTYNGSKDNVSRTYPKNTNITLLTPDYIDGIDFLGWYYEPGGDGGMVGGAGDGYVITDNITVYAAWRVKDFAITANTIYGNIKTDAEFITSATFINHTEINVTPDSHVNAIVTIIENDVAIQKLVVADIVCPAEKDNLVWITVPTTNWKDYRSYRIEWELDFSNATVSDFRPSNNKSFLESFRPNETMVVGNPATPHYQLEPDAEFNKYATPDESFLNTYSWSYYAYEDGEYVLKEESDRYKIVLLMFPENANGVYRPYYKDSYTVVGGKYRVKDYITRSGYGFSLDREHGVTMDDTALDGQYSHVEFSSTSGHLIATMLYPEFNYARTADKCSVLNTTYQDGVVKLSFKPYDNLQSSDEYDLRSHYSPMWFPDGKYTPITVFEGVWTPVGEMRAIVRPGEFVSEFDMERTGIFTNTLTIKGSMYDDIYTN